MAKQTPHMKPPDLQQRNYHGTVSRKQNYWEWSGMLRKPDIFPRNILMQLQITNICSDRIGVF